MSADSIQYTCTSSQKRTMLFIHCTRLFLFQKSFLCKILHFSTLFKFNTKIYTQHISLWNQIIILCKLLSYPIPHHLHNPRFFGMILSHRKYFLGDWKTLVSKDVSTHSLIFKSKQYTKIRITFGMQLNSFKFLIKKTIYLIVMYSWPPEQHTPTWRLLVFISLTWNQRFLRGSYTSILLKGSPEAPRPPTQNNTPAKNQFSKIWSTMSLTLKKNQHRFMTMITLTMKFGGLVWWANSSVTGSYIWKMSHTEMLSCSILQCFHQISFKILQHPLPLKIKLKTTTTTTTATTK